MGDTSQLSSLTPELLDLILSPQGMGGMGLEQYQQQVGLPGLESQIAQPAPVPPISNPSPDFRTMEPRNKAAMIMSALSDVLMSYANVKGAKGLIPPLPPGRSLQNFLGWQQEGINQRAGQKFAGERSQYESSVKKAMLRREDIIRQMNQEHQTNLKNLDSTANLEEINARIKAKLEEDAAKSLEKLASEASEMGVVGADTMTKPQLLDAKAKAYKATEASDAGFKARGLAVQEKNSETERMRADQAAAKKPPKAGSAGYEKYMRDGALQIKTSVVSKYTPKAAIAKISQDPTVTLQDMYEFAKSDVQKSIDERGLDPDRASEVMEYFEKYFGEFMREAIKNQASAPAAAPEVQSGGPLYPGAGLAKKLFGGG